MCIDMCTNMHVQNHKDVLVVVDTEDYPALLDFLKGNEDDQQFRRKLAWKAFQHVASYDSAVSEWLWKQTVGGKSPCFICAKCITTWIGKNLCYHLVPDKVQSMHLLMKYEGKNICLLEHSILLCYSGGILD